MAHAVAGYVNIRSDSDHPKQQCNVGFVVLVEICCHSEMDEDAKCFDEECLQMEPKKIQDSNHILTLLHCRLLKEFIWEYK